MKGRESSEKLIRYVDRNKKWFSENGGYDQTGKIGCGG